MILDLPATKVFIYSQFLQAKHRERFTEAYLVAVTTIPGRPLLFTVHTVDGAVYSRLPIHSFQTKETKQALSLYDLSDLQPWSCLEGPAFFIQHSYLKGYTVHAKVKGNTLIAEYFGTIDYFGGGLASDPEQHKTHNLIMLDNGQMAALPNNHCLFVDKHFVKKPYSWPKYRRQTENWKIDE